MKVFHKNVEVRHWLQDYGFDKESHTVLGQPFSLKSVFHRNLACIIYG